MLPVCGKFRILAPMSVSETFNCARINTSIYDYKLQFNKISTGCLRAAWTDKCRVRATIRWGGIELRLTNVSAGDAVTVCGPCLFLSERWKVESNCVCEWMCPTESKFTIVDDSILCA